ncbi:serpin family protein, partial [Kipferlia bialata]
LGPVRVAEKDQEEPASGVGYIVGYDDGTLLAFAVTDQGRVYTHNLTPPLSPRPPIPSTLRLLEYAQPLGGAPGRNPSLAIRHRILFIGSSTSTPVVYKLTGDDVLSPLLSELGLGFLAAPFRQCLGPVQDAIVFRPHGEVTDLMVTVSGHARDGLLAIGMPCYPLERLSAPGPVIPTPSPYMRCFGHANGQYLLLSDRGAGYTSVFRVEQMDTVRFRPIAPHHLTGLDMEHATLKVEPVILNTGHMCSCDMSGPGLAKHAAMERERLKKARQMAVDREGKEPDAETLAKQDMTKLLVQVTHTEIRVLCNDPFKTGPNKELPAGSLVTKWVAPHTSRGHLLPLMGASVSNTFIAVSRGRRIFLLEMRVTKKDDDGSMGVDLCVRANFKTTKEVSCLTVVADASKPMRSGQPVPEACRFPGLLFVSTYSGHLHVLSLPPHSMALVDELACPYCLTGLPLLGHYHLSDRATSIRVARLSPAVPCPYLLVGLASGTVVVSQLHIALTEDACDLFAPLRVPVEGASAVQKAPFPGMAVADIELQETQEVTLGTEPVSMSFVYPVSSADVCPHVLVRSSRSAFIFCDNESLCCVCLSTTPPARITEATPLGLAIDELYETPSVQLLRDPAIGLGPANPVPSIARPRTERMGSLHLDPLVVIVDQPIHSRDVAGVHDAVRDQSQPEYRLYLVAPKLEYSIAWESVLLKRTPVSVTYSEPLGCLAVLTEHYVTKQQIRFVDYETMRVVHELRLPTGLTCAVFKILPIGGSLILVASLYSQAAFAVEMDDVPDPRLAFYSVKEAISMPGEIRALNVAHIGVETLSQPCLSMSMHPKGYAERLASQRSMSTLKPSAKDSAVVAAAVGSSVVEIQFHGTENPPFLIHSSASTAPSVSQSVVSPTQLGISSGPQFGSLSDDNLSVSDDDLEAVSGDALLPVFGQNGRGAQLSAFELNPDTAGDVPVPAGLPAIGSVWSFSSLQTLLAMAVAKQPSVMSSYVSPPKLNNTRHPFAGTSMTSALIGSLDDQECETLDEGSKVYLTNRGAVESPTGRVNMQLCAGQPTYIKNIKALADVLKSKESTREDLFFPVNDGTCVLGVESGGGVSLYQRVMDGSGEWSLKLIAADVHHVAPDPKNALYLPMKYAVVVDHSGAFRLLGVGESTIDVALRGRDETEESIPLHPFELVAECRLKHNLNVIRQIRPQLVFRDAPLTKTQPAAQSTLSSPSVSTRPLLHPFGPPPTSPNGSARPTPITVVGFSDAGAVVIFCPVHSRHYTLLNHLQTSMSNHIKLQQHTSNAVGSWAHPSSKCISSESQVAQLYSAIHLGDTDGALESVAGILKTVKAEECLEVATNVFARDCDPTQAFVSEVLESLDCEPTLLTSAQQVNQWCSDATHGHITEILQSLPKDVFSVLISAVYFEAEWEVPFSRSYTGRGLFTQFNGKARTIYMMHKGHTQMTYKHSDGMQLVSLPYRNSDVRAVIALPDQKGRSAFAKAGRILVRPGYTSEGTRTAEVTFALPRFSMESEHDLLDMLKEMGVPTDLLDCSTTLRCRLNTMKVSGVTQKATLTVTEKGTIASAATAILQIGGGGPPPPPEATVICDRPFWFMLYLGDTLLFKAAKCTAPKGVEKQMADAYRHMYGLH